MDVEMKSKNYTYFSERSYTGKDCKIDDKVVDYWKKVLGDNVFNNIEKVYNLRPEIVMSKKDFENVTESKEILQFSELFQTGFGENVKYQLKIGEKGAFVFDRFLDHFIKFGIAVLNEQEIDECIMDSYIDNIIRQISKISMGTLMFEMYICREQGLLVGNNSNEEYVYYNTHFLGDKKYINELFEIYPCLERMIFESIFYLVNNYKELLIRLKKDHDYLVEQLCDRKKFKKVVKMQSDISDSHKRGKTVSVLTLDNDVKVVYKPRSLKGEKAYQDFQTYISQGSKLKARTFKVIDCGNYGWEEFVESKPCSDMQQLRNYYYRFGELILQNYILNANDLHEENVIAYGEYPIVIDAESIIIIPAIFVQKIVNNLTYAPESFEFRKMILFILGITIALFLSNFIKKRCILILQSDIYKETIQQMIDKIFKIDISFFEGHASGDIQNRFNSVSEIYQFISITLISAIINAVTAIMCALVMMLQSFYLFQILFIIAAAQILIVYFLNKRARIKIKNYIADQSELQGKMVEILTNIQQIRCMRIDTILCKNIKGDYQHLIQRLKEKAQISDFIETIATTFTTISPMLLYTMGGFLIINSNLELGALVSFITLSTYFTGPFQTLSLIIPQISVLRETMLRINELMNYSDEIQSGKQSIGRFESISLKNVTFKYLGSNEPDLKGINITIKRGEKIAIVGESGSGKTTISKLLLNALTKYEGEILLNGYNINSIKREAIDHIFTIVTQVPMAISGTIRDNIDISHDLSDDEIYSCLKTAELENDVNKFPMKLNTFVGENGQNISGGQKQRIAIARALALKPEVLILDEATSNLDPITERKICDNLKKLHITQIIITHRLSQVEDADMIYVLNHGEIMEKGSHEQLMKGKGLYSKLVRIA